MKSLLIWGCGGFGREVLVLAEALDIPVLGFLDERPEMKGVMVEGIPVLGDISQLECDPAQVQVTFGVGDPLLKSRLYQKTISYGFSIAPVLIHPGVVYSKRGFVAGEGSVICAGCALTLNIRIGKGVIINQLCSVGHDGVIHDFATLSPGVMMSGNVEIGSFTYVGTGAVIKEKIKIGSESVIAGAAFIGRDVPDRVMVAGVPAIIKKEL